MTEIRERVSAFELGHAALSVRLLDLTGMTPRQVYAMLTGRGFVHRRSSMVAYRTRDGGPAYRRSDGEVTTDAKDPHIAPMDVYVHRDGGFVRVFPAAEPPWAYAGVLLVAPRTQEDRFTGHAQMDFDALPRNEACRVSTSCHPIPRGPRRVDGLKYDPKNKLKSFMFSREVLDGSRMILAAHEQP